MKVIAIYSGKGGVGKSTVASLLALALAKKHKTALIDLDLNTPSLPVLFKKNVRIKNLTIKSLGYEKTPMIMSGKFLQLHAHNLMKKISKMNPEICILDMPPSISEIHLEFCIHFKPSSFILVNQPNDLSKTDLLKSIKLFSHLQIPIMGLIDNMTGTMFGQESQINGIKCLLNIPLQKSIADAGSSGKLHRLKNNPLSKISDEIFRESKPIAWNKFTKPSETTWNGISEEDVQKLIDRTNDPNFFATLKYMGLNSWELIREHLEDNQGSFAGDDFLLHNDTRTIKEMLEAFNYNDNAMFMVIRTPHTAIHLYPGEIGFGRLLLNERGHYGVPRIAYMTDEGEVHLFPHEVSHKNEDFVINGMRDGELKKVLNSQVVRYVPTKEVLELVESTFGNRTGIHPDWKMAYNKLVCQ